MFNLLTDAHRKAIRREYLARFATLALWFIFGLGVLSFASLLPSYFLTVEREKVALQNQDVITQSLEIKDGSEIEAVAKRFNSKLSMFLGIDERQSIHEFIEKIVADKTSSISIVSFTFRSQGEGSNKGSILSMIGVAKDRASLARFSKTLEQYPGITKVDLPVSNFAKDTNIEFSIKAEGDF